MRTLNNVELNALREAMSDLGPELFGSNSYEVSIEQANNKLTITLSEKDYQGQFEEYLRTLDDEIFTAACEYYTHVTGENLSKIKTITPELIAKFKEVVKIVVRKKIKGLVDKYGC